MELKTDFSNKLMLEKMAHQKSKIACRALRGGRPPSGERRRPQRPDIFVAGILIGLVLALLAHHFMPKI